MKHFELAKWIDSVRGLVEESVRVAMEHHLASGCRTCRRTAELVSKFLNRQTLYQAGDYSFDLGLEKEPGSPRVALVGQIQNRKEPGSHLGSVPVLLLSGKQIVAQAVSNSLGEFQMEYTPTKRLRLYVRVRQAGKRTH